MTSNVSTARIVGIDVGGTFTDLTIYDPASGETRAVKAPSVRHAPDEGVLATLAKSGVELADLGRIIHGTTVATNAILERRGALTALVTTEGFRDVIEIGRTTRLAPNTLYDPYFVRTSPLVPRHARYTVRERINGDTSVEVPLDPAICEELAETIAGEGYDCVAICFLNAYANPEHEKLAADIFRARFEHVTASHEVLNEIREYERFSTTVMNGYLKPLIATYTSRLTKALRRGGFAGPFYTTASNGGLMNEANVRAQPVRTVLSGPAAGVAAAHYVAEQIGRSNYVTYDMGGTSSDVALVTDEGWPVKRETVVDGLLVKAPQLDIHTIGAGGGSIARLDEGGSLFVGPDSAGADPGPACYGHGGREPTITDANVVLGRIGAGQSLGGSLNIDVEAAHTVIGRLARRAGLGVEDMALGILDIAVTKMSVAIYEISIARGTDPRDLTLMPFGGAGPLHACLIADELGIGEVVVPPLPGAFSAFGGFCASPFKERQETVLLRLDSNTCQNLTARAEAFANDVTTGLVEEGFEASTIRHRCELDCRYVGQSHEITIEVDVVDDENAICTAFETAFKRQFSRLDSDRAIEIVNIRIIGEVVTTPPPLPRLKRLAADAPAAERTVVTQGGPKNCPIHGRDDLAAGSVLDGPLIVEEMSSTTYVPPGWSLEIGGFGEMVVTRGPGRTRSRQTSRRSQPVLVS